VASVPAIRDATTGDCRAVAEVHVASWRGAYAHLLPSAFLAGLSVDKREASWQSVLAEGHSQLLVAEAKGEIVGFSSFGASRDADAPAGRGELWALYVHPGAWCTGTGRALWQATRGRLQARDFTSASLWVLEGNQRGIAFYAKSGFAPDAGSAKAFELGGTRLREVRMLANLLG
jgi:ribosomal protein S18 acetylase RimI-like enzyme